MVNGSDDGGNDFSDGSEVEEDEGTQRRGWMRILMKKRMNEDGDWDTDEDDEIVKCYDNNDENDNNENDNNDNDTVIIMIQ